MTAPQFTGSDEELADILESWNAHEKLAAWRDAAVARHLAEAGAVHSAVHTPNRVMQWLGEHGWQAATSAYTHPYTTPWKYTDGGTAHVVRDTGCPDYVEWTGVVMRAAAAESGLSVRQVLLEIAQMPDEVVW